MKVVLLAPTPPPYGGIAEWTQRMLNAELKNGWEVVVVDEKVSDKRGAYTTKRDFVEEFKRCNRIWSDLKSTLKDSDAKVVHCCIPATTFAMIRELISSIITKHRKRKFIIHFRCTVPNMVKGRIGKIILKKLCDNSDLIMALNSQTQCFLETITKTKIQIIPNFVSDDELKLGESYKVKESMSNAIYVGGVMPSKGCDNIVEIAKMRKDIHFELIGKVDETIANTVKNEGLCNISLPGPMKHEEVIEHMRQADLFVFMTRYEGEGFSNALTEAMSVGLPCLVTDWAANADMIENKGGSVVSVGDIDAAVTALTMMDKCSVRTEMSNWNKEKVKREYSAKIVTDRYVNVYESII